MRHRVHLRPTRAVLSLLIDHRSGLQEMRQRQGPCLRQLQDEVQARATAACDAAEKAAP